MNAKEIIELTQSMWPYLKDTDDINCYIINLKIKDIEYMLVYNPTLINSLIQRTLEEYKEKVQIRLLDPRITLTCPISELHSLLGVIMLLPWKSELF